MMRGASRLGSAGIRDLGARAAVGRQCYVMVSTASDSASRRTPPPLPKSKIIELEGVCKIEYVDTLSTRSPQSSGHLKTLVMLHGAPGSYRDFRYLTPLLVQHPDIRVIGINLPGYGRSEVAKQHDLDTFRALRSSEVALSAIQRICGDRSDNVFLVGHSFGSHAAITMAVQNAETLGSGLRVRGIALLAPAGCVPHRSLRMGSIGLTVRLLQSQSPLAVALATHFTIFVYTKLLGFPSASSAKLYVSAVMRAGTTDFSLIRDQVEHLAKIRMPTFIAWSRDDHHIQLAIPEELAALSHEGPRLEFSSGGHNIQKTRATEIAAALCEWVDDLVSS